VTVVDVEDSFICKTCFFVPENIFIKHSGSMLLAQPSQNCVCRSDIAGADVSSTDSGVDAVYHLEVC
jgi:hypothetical protein